MGFPILRALALGAILGWPGAAAPLAGIVHMQGGAVSALAGRGEDIDIRRGTRSLRVDVGDELRTSGDLEGVLIAHDETQVPLEPGSVYTVDANGIWKTVPGGRNRVLQFRVPVRSSPTQVPTEPTRPVARARAHGVIRYRDARETRPGLLDLDQDLHPNSWLEIAREGSILIAANQGGRGLFTGPGALRIQEKNLVLEAGTLSVLPGGPASVVLAPSFSVAAGAGGLFVVSVKDGVSTVRAIAGRIVIGPLPGGRGTRLELVAGQVASASLEGRPQLAPGERLPGDPGSIAAALRTALSASDPLGAAQAIEAALAGSPALAPQDLEPAPAGRAAPPARTPPAAQATGIGSDWSSRDRRGPPVPVSSWKASAAPHPAFKPGEPEPTSPRHPIWTTAFALETPPLPGR